VESSEGCDDVPRKPREKSKTGIYHIVVRGTIREKTLEYLTTLRKQKTG